jgi:hypothetical protein
MKTDKRAKNMNAASEPSSMLMLPLCIVLAVLPIIVHIKIYNTGLSKYAWSSSQEQYGDVFLYYKQCFFTIMSVLMAFIIFADFMAKKRFKSIPKTFILPVIYAALSLLSSIFAKNRDFAFTGSFEQFEDVWCLMGYVLVMYYVYIYARKIKKIRLLIICMLAGAFLVGIIGTMQYFGHNIFNSAIYQKIIGAGNLGLTVSDATYSTLFNSNYVGTYASFILPLIAVLFFYEEKWYMLLLYIAAGSVMLIALFGSKSEAGLLVLICMIPIVLLFCRKRIIKKYYIYLPVIIAGLAGVIIFNVKTHFYLAGTVKTMLTQLSVPVVDNLEQIETADKGSNGKDIPSEVAKNGYLKIKYSGNYYIVQALKDDASGNFLVYAKAEDGTAFDQDAATGTLTAPDAPSLYFNISDYDNTHYVLTFNIDGIKWQFLCNDDSSKYRYVNAFGRCDSMHEVSSVLFNNHKRLISGRGYLWSRALTLVKDKIILGVGADNYVLFFPNDDYVGKMQAGYSASLVTKPHCMYLQWAANSGLIAAIALTAFLIIYLIQSVRLYFTSELEEKSKQAGMAIALGTFAYMVAGIANDSSICVAPVFFIMLGAGYTINSMALSKMKKQEKA